MNSSGKVLTVFLVIIGILLISLTAISLFFFQQETEKRKIVEISLEHSKANEHILQEDLKKVKKENYLLQEKNKEVDEKINNLLDEIELQEGVREEIKKENASLKEQLEKEKKAKEDVRDQLTIQIKESEKKIKDLEEQLKNAPQVKPVLDSESRLWEGDLGNGSVLKNETNVTENPSASAVPGVVNSVKLDQIVVSPDMEIEPEKIVTRKKDGRVLNVDTQTEFLIVNLGTKDGVDIGNVLSVYRGKEYLGDVRVSRVQPEMSAADLIPPFSSRHVRRNDQVIIKQ